jgi:flagellar FliJ protein
MKRFQFRLQSVLEHRQRKETIAHLSHGEAQTQLNRAKALFEELEDAKRAIIEELSDRQVRLDFDPDETRLYFEYLTTVKNCIRDQEIYVAELATRVESLRLELVGAAQQRQVIDKMKITAHSDHQITAQKAEQSAIDDLASTRRHFLQLQLGQE